MNFFLFGLQDWRDIIVIAAGSLMILVLLAIFIFTVVLGMAARALLGTVRSTLRDDVSPLLESAQQTLHTVRGTTAFIGETAITPIVRVYGVVSGAKRAAAVVSGITRRRKDRQ